MNDTLLARLRAFFTPAVTLDLRSLGAFRVVLGAVVLFDLGQRVRSFGMYTTPELIPDGALTLHALGASPALAALSFAIHGACAVAFLLGWRARVFAVALYFLQISHIERLPLGINGADIFLTALLLWSILLPLDQRLSIGTRWSRAPGTYCEVPSVGIVLQVASVFIATGFEKLMSPYWQNGEALRMFLEAYGDVTSIGERLRDGLPGLLPLMTWATLVLEIVAPICLLLPWWRVRVAGAAVLFGLMFAIALSLDVGIFPLVTAASFVPLLPPELWRNTDRASPAPPPQHHQPRPVVVIASVVLVLLAVGHLRQIGQTTFWMPHIAERSALQQRWAMFHRPDQAVSGYIFVVGPLADGTLFDVVQMKPARLNEIPPPLASTPTTHRERNLIVGAHLVKDPSATYAITAWLCRRAPVKALRFSYASVRIEGILTHWTRADVICPSAPGELARPASPLPPLDDAPPAAPPATAAPAAPPATAAPAAPPATAAAPSAAPAAPSAAAPVDAAAP